MAGEIGYPVVLKISDRTILHKSDVGGVRLNLQNETALRSAYREMTSNGKKPAAGHGPVHVLVEEMVQKPMVAELIANLRVDPVFGPVIVVGMGGIFTELWNDYVVLKPPLTRAQIEAALKRLKGYRLLTGYRHSPGRYRRVGPCDSSFGVDRPTMGR